MDDKDVKRTSFGTGGFFAFRYLGAVFLLTCAPLFVFLIWYVCYGHKGSVTSYWEEISQITLAEYMERAVPTPFDPVAWKVILSYSAFQLFLMKFVPGAEFRGGMTPTGHVPVYTDNGVACYFISIAVLLYGFYSGMFELDYVYDNMGKLLATSNFIATGLLFFLVYKGINFPSTKDSGSSGSIVYDLFWGTELYPRILGFDVKQFTNCRYGMMYWQLGIICYAAKQYSVLGYVSSSMAASVIIQTVYIWKFFVWETGYFNSMDIQHDRAGFGICWGCMVWLPCVYTIHTYFLVEHPILLSTPTFACIVAAGLLCIWTNYDCDRQRQTFRAPGGTKVQIWGADPEYILATYRNKDNGSEHKSMLLLSGWWGVARHFHYVPEIGAAFFWCVPALFTHPVPYFYVFFLSLLLFDRAFRDDKRCSEKYGKYWDMYRRRVPYKIVPGIV